MPTSLDIGDKIGGPIVGHYVAYGVSLNQGPQWMINEIQIDYSSERKDLRAYRETRRERGRSLPEIGDDKLADELLVIFGPELSPQDAVATLEKLVAHIKANGLIIGRGKPEEDVYYEERLDGEILHR